MGLQPRRGFVGLSGTGGCAVGTGNSPVACGAFGAEGTTDARTAPLSGFVYRFKRGGVEWRGTAGCERKAEQ
ncbi:MAG: twin-arginine translocation signal domain-containing protein [Chloroflexi bacterium]|nr:twin-arginine translocation signal domain-containing protein [Chloroflexota bacterium]